MAFPSNTHLSPSWTGFLMGLFGGFAVSSLFVGLVLGYAVSGAFGGVGPRSGGIAQQAGPPSAPTPPAPPAPVAAKPVPGIGKTDHVRGNPKAKVTVVEYSDFECPFCKRHAPTMKQVLDAYKNDVNVVYRHFPLQFHQNAQKEAEASECVAELGGNDAFWKFHDMIFDRTTAGGTGIALDKLGPMAKEAGVNQAKFQSCLDSGKYAKYVQDQEQEGIDVGVQGTPANFVINNDTKETRDISGAVPFSSFQSTIDQILGKKS